MKPSADLAEAAEPDEAVPGGNALLWGLGAVAVGFALWRPRSPGATLALVDWQTVGALAGLLAITQAVERSGV
ncbi:MAG: citrate transporter, partial [Burkholderiales bacterium]|nr:citrate transporter [Burkholderiales bacterium]